MSDNFYSASLSRTQGRNTWAVIFRHPKRTDPTTGKEGLRVRQSLKTDNEQEAATLRDGVIALPSSQSSDYRGAFCPRRGCRATAWHAHARGPNSRS